MLDLSKITGFDWDDGNKEKSWLKHSISNLKCEEVFFNQPLFLFEDLKHSQNEKRYYVVGKTDEKKCLYIIFTVRKCKIRIISARHMHKKEIDSYYNNLLKQQ